MSKMSDIMKNMLSEVELKLVKSNLGTYPIAKLKGFIDKSIGERLQASFNMKYNAKEKYYYWWLDKDDPQKTINKSIRPAMEFIKSLQNSEEAAAKIEFEIDKILDFLNSGDVETSDPEVKVTQLQKDEIEAKLLLFKKQLTNIQDDEQFKETMSKFLRFRGALGYKYTPTNTLLIWIQNPNATIVNNKDIWKEDYNRTIKPDAKPILVWRPKGKQFSYPKDKKEQITKDFLASIKKTSMDSLTPNEKIRLKTKLRPPMLASAFELVPAYDVSQTVQMEGKEDYITGAQDAIKSVEWFEDGMLDESVRPIYMSLLEFCKDHGIQVDFSDNLGGARGVSKNGKITLLTNEGNDVGTTKTFAHEISHELLHQTYVKMQGKVDFYVGRENDGNKTIEQQAEISAWMFMYAFGFDMKTTSLNYTIMWGGNPENMVTVFETVSKMVNFLIDFVNTRINKYNQEMAESMGSPTHGSHITPEEIAKRLGIGKEFKQIQQKEDIKETLRKRFRL